MKVHKFLREQLNGYGTLQETAEKLALYKPKDVTLTFAIPRNIKEEAGRHWLYTMFETDKPPLEWGRFIVDYERVIVPNKWQKKAYDLAYGIDTEIIDCGIHKYWINNNPINRVYKKSEFIFFMHEAFNMRKGFEYAYEAFNKYILPRFNARLVLRSQYHQAIAMKYETDGVDVIEGDLPREKVRDLLLKAHCFVFPSKAEGFGLAPIEAMSTGMPVIASDIPPLLEHNLPYLYCKTKGTTPTTYGIYENVGVWQTIDVHDLGAKMINMIENYEMYVCLTMFSQKYLRGRFDLWNNFMRCL